MDFARECLQHTAYYFRLGRRYKRRDPEGGYEAPDVLTAADGDYLEFKPHEYIQVWSLEEFYTDESVLGILGAVSDVGRHGLTLVNSPFIDPLYPGPGRTAPLELGLANLNASSASIRVGTSIGKVAFFDISDSGPISIVAGSEIARKYAERQAVSEEQAR